MRTLAWALGLLAEGFGARADENYKRSRKIREAQKTDAQTGEMTELDPDDMYELGFAEGASTAYRVAREKIAEAAKLAEDRTNAS